MVGFVVDWTRRARWALFLLGAPAVAHAADPDDASIEAPVVTPPPAAPAPPPSSIVPPRAEANEGPLYPEGAHGDASVVLELTVRRDGTTEKLEVVSGEEPFASA